MWHWLRKSVLAIDPLIRQCVVVSGGLHLFFIIAMIAFHWFKPVQQIAIFQHASVTKDVTIIIDPHAPVTGVIMQKRTHAAANGSSHSTNASVKSEVKKPATTMVAEKKSAPARKKTPQKATPKKTVSKPKKQKLPKKEPAKPKKVTPKKPIKAEPKKEPAKKEALKPKEILEKKDITQKIEPPVTQAPQQEPVSALPDGISLPEGIEGPIMIARSTADAAGLAVQLEIQEALLAVWRPPVGIDEGISCQIRVQLKSDGTMQSLEITKPSGMILFDVSARAALQKTVWPRAVWGTVLELCLQ